MENNNEKTPAISVIMGVYNGLPFLREAVESVLKQTCGDFEFLVCDDCSADGSGEVLAELAAGDGRIRLLKNEKNLGLAATLNRCLAQARGTYIARMDCDDASLPERFTRQKQWLEAHPEVAAVGTAVEYMDDRGNVYGRTPHPEERLYGLNDVVRGSVLVHPSVMLRTGALRAVGGYSVNALTTRAEDYDLWCKLCEHGGRVANMGEILFRYREDASNLVRRKYKYRIQEARLKAAWVKRAGLPLPAYRYALKPLLVGLIPQGLYKKLHRKRLTGE